jgi:CheY-like chemotaxis protein
MGRGRQVPLYPAKLAVREDLCACERERGACQAGATTAAERQWKPQRALIRNWAGYDNRMFRETSARQTRSSGPTGPSLHAGSACAARKPVSIPILYDLYSRSRMAERRRPRLLIVDDHPDVARALARVFEFDADVATDVRGADALRRIASGERFDLVLCDVMMPGMTGIELFERARAIDPGVAAAFVFTTGGIAAEYAKPLAATGARCLDKPCDVAELKRLLGATGQERK